METTEDTLIVPEVTALADDTGPIISDVTDVNIPEDDGEDPIDAAIEAKAQLLLEQRLKGAEAQLTERLTQQYEARTRSTLEAREQTALRDSFADAIKEAHTQLKNLDIYDKDNNPVEIDDKTFEEFVAKPFQRHNSQVQQTVQQRLLNTIADAAVNILPAEVRDDFGKKAAQKPIDQWLRIFAETLAPHTESVKQAQKELDVKVKAAEARGFARGQRNPAGAPKQVSERASDNTQLDLTTHIGLARALHLGLLPGGEAEYRERRGKLEE